MAVSRTKERKVPKKSAMVRARIEPRLKDSAEKCFAHLGLTATQAITLFYRQVELQRGLPFELTVPNEDTIEAANELDSGKGRYFDSAEELFKHLGI